MYEHVICIISLNSTLRSSNPEVRVLDSGLKGTLVLRAAKEGDGGATQILHQSSSLETLHVVPLYCSLTR